MIEIKTNDEKLGEIIYGYTANISQLEEETSILKETINQMKNELDRYRRTPLMVCEVRQVLGTQAVIKIPNGNQFLVEVSKDCEKLRAGDSVLVEQKNLTVIKKARGGRRHSVEKYVIMEKPTTQWKDIGGMAKQIEEIREVIELPLLKPELFQKIGIEPPKGLLLHGPPGTGKTMLAKAVASSTSSTFIEIVGSEMVQKFIGEGAKMVKEIFALAREKAPAIIFIDEMDAIAARRIEVGTSGEREVQRTFMQLLAEIDGFRNLGNIKVIGCTNRKDILDPAILRPGRLDRQIFVGLPDAEGRKEIFRVHMKGMNTSTVNIDRIVELTPNMSGAEVKSICTEAGYFAIRKNRSQITQEDMVAAIEKVKNREGEQETGYVNMFG